MGNEVKDDVERIYEQTVEVLTLAYSAKDAKERLDGQVLVNQTIEEPKVSDFSHLNNVEWRKSTISRLTQKIKVKERR